MTTFVIYLFFIVNEINWQIFTTGPNITSASFVIIYTHSFPPEQNWFDSIFIMLPQEMISQLEHNVIKKY